LRLIRSKYNIRQIWSDYNSRIVNHDLVREAIDKILADAPEGMPRKEPTRSLRGLLAKYGPAPSAEEIDENRAEMFANFPRADF
jgi:hypothetical protein